MPRRILLLEPNEIVKVDVVQIEFEVMIMIVQIVRENRHWDERSIHEAIYGISKCKSLRVYPPARLKKAPLLIGAECERRTDPAIRHHHIPIVSEEIVQYARQILLNEGAQIRIIDHVVGDAQAEDDSRILVA